MPHQRYILIETIISAILNAIVGALFVFLMFGGVAKVSLWGQTGLAFDLVPTVFMITLMTTIALTLITRRRLSTGKIEPALKIGRLPANPILRGLLLAVAATILIVPLSVAILYGIWPSTGDWSFNAVLIFKIVFSGALGFLVTPIIVGNALRDKAGRRPAPAS